MGLLQHQALQASPAPCGELCTKQKPSCGVPSCRPAICTWATGLLRSLRNGSVWPWLAWSLKQSHKKRLIVISGWLGSMWTLLRLCLVRGEGGDRSPLTKTVGTPKFCATEANTWLRARKVRVRDRAASVRAPGSPAACCGARGARAGSLVRARAHFRLRQVLLCERRMLRVCAAAAAEA